MFENEFKLEDLCSGIFSDNLDRLGYYAQIATGFQRNQHIMRFMGRVRTVQLETVETDDENIQMGLSFIDTLNANDVLVVSGSNKFAYFGEMMTRLCIRQGIQGVIIDGFTRDSIFTHDNCKLPILAKGYTPVDIKKRGRVKSVDVPISVDGISVYPKSFVFADNDAACFVPVETEEQLKALIASEIKEEAKRVALISKGASVAEILSVVKAF